MRPILAFAALAALTIACGGGTPTSPSPAASLPGFTLHRGFVRATVDGSRWESTVAMVENGPSSGGSPVMSVVTVAVGSALSVSITAPRAVGTYQSGASPVMFSLYEGSSVSWSVGPFATGGSGTLTITTATATRIAGTFSFTAVTLAPGVTPATRIVRDGAFDLSQ